MAAIEAPLPASGSTFYTPLQADDEVRLLYLQPLDVDGKVVCKIQHAKLSKNPQYESLSYCWGVTTTQKISIEGQDIQVRTNLWAALKQLSPTENTRCLWIDALCINQADIEERNKQVAQMGKIYGQATSVVVWLGPESEDSVLAFQLLATPVAWTRMWRSTDENPIDPALEVTLQPFITLCEREYWQRLWIVQEIFLAQKVSILCGSKITSWLRLSWFFCSFPNQHESTQAGLDLPPNVEQFAQAVKSSNPWRFFTHHRRASARGQNPTSHKPKPAIPAPPLHHLCVEYGMARCEDPRDKVYGLHALAADCCKSQVVVDYSVKDSEIWTKLLRHLVQGRHTIGGYEGTEGLVREIQLLHKTLNVSPRAYKEYIQPLIHTAVSTVAYPGKTRDALILEGRARGVITYISPPLNEPLPSNSSINFLQLTSWNAEEIVYIYDKLPTEQTQQPKILTTAFDIVQPIITTRTSTLLTASRNFSSTFKYLDFGTLWSAKESTLSKEELSTRFLAILRVAHAAIPSMYASTCRLAVEQNGLICFVPPNVEVGDMIVQFRGCSVLGIVRTEGDQSPSLPLRSALPSSSSPPFPPPASLPTSTLPALLSKFWKTLTPDSTPDPTQIPAPAGNTPSLSETMPPNPHFRIIGRAANFLRTEDTMLYDAAGLDFSKHWESLNGRRMDLEGDYATLRDLTIASERNGGV